MLTKRKFEYTVDDLVFTEWQVIEGNEIVGRFPTEEEADQMVAEGNDAYPADDMSVVRNAFGYD